MSTPIPHKALPPLVFPEHDPGPDDCPHFTRYIPFGGVMVTVECIRPIGHELDPDPEVARHYGTYLVDETEVEFYWTPPTPEELEEQARAAR
jgi:hypothetical protein